MNQSCPLNPKSVESRSGKLRVYCIWKDKKMKWQIYHPNMPLTQKPDATGLMDEWIRLTTSLSDYEVNQKRDIGRCFFGYLR
jgi:hypothetical protein